MASQSAEDKLNFILTVLKHTDLPQPDYHAVAEETGTNNVNNAQMKFRAIAKAAGFDLINKQIVDSSGSTGGSARGNSRASSSTLGTPKKTTTTKKATPKKTPAQVAATPRAIIAANGKKRRIEEIMLNSDGEGDGADDMEVKHEADSGSGEDDSNDGEEVWKRKE